VIGRLPFALDVCGGGRGLSARARTGVDGPLRLIVPSNGFSKQMRGYSAFADMLVRVRVMDRCCGFGMWWGASGVRREKFTRTVSGSAKVDQVLRLLLTFFPHVFGVCTEY